ISKEIVFFEGKSGHFWPDQNQPIEKKENLSGHFWLDRVKNGPIVRVSVKLSVAGNKKRC
ncbi:hypothetical protein, partial [Burkholderia sp. Ac-20349]|uniref:hypothetical protein n=1 Tax=Burkholderia sp. Ac-20349 TaxID=2703893 RepID=UPI00197B5C3F